MQAVDELVEQVFERLEQLDELDNTYVIYTCTSSSPFRELKPDLGHTTADNGFAIGTRRRQPGKTLGYEQDLHVPLIIRGPGIIPGSRDSVSSWGMVDLAKTIMGLAGATADYVDDGREIVLPRVKAEGVDGVVNPARETDWAISEFWVLGVEEGTYAGKLKQVELASRFQL